MLQPNIVKVEPMQNNQLRLFYETGEQKNLMCPCISKGVGLVCSRMSRILPLFTCSLAAPELSGQTDRILHHMNYMKTV